MVGPDRRDGQAEIGGLDLYVPTVTGREFYPLQPSPADIAIEDIATGLSRQFRCNKMSPCTVAQHACLVSLIAERNVRLSCPTGWATAAWWGLHHDDAEAWLWDCDGRLKPRVRLDGEAFDAVETRILAAVADHFAMPRLGAALAEIVKRADLLAFAVERRDMFPIATRRGWTALPPAPASIGWQAPLAPEAARAAFLARHHELGDVLRREA